MKHLLTALSDLHQSLVEALDAGDCERVTELIACRQDQIDDLGRALQAASPAVRADVRPALEALLVDDRDLQARTRAMRDQLRTRLDAGQARPERREPMVVTGILDRKA